MPQFATPQEFAGQSFGIYPRVSTQQQGTGDKASLDAQIEACQEYGEDLGMLLDPQCVKEERHTSTTSDRPELKALLRLMIARHVQNLVIDRVDRITREGQLPAALLLTQFTDAGILLHVVSDDLVVRDEDGVEKFLRGAYAAQRANVSRIRALVQTRKQYAKRDGRYYSGNRPPYGFTKHVDARNERGLPTKFHFEADRRVVNGHVPWEVRRDICRWYLAGMSGYRIAVRLSKALVPTSRTLVGQQHKSAHWSATTIYDMLDEGINEGIVTSGRTRQQKGWSPPDAKHPKRWKRREAVPFAEQIRLPDTTVAPDAIILTHEEAARIRARLKTGKPQSPRGATHALAALFIGGVARCGIPRPDDPSTPCGGALRVKTEDRPGKGAGSRRYVCRTHETQPTKCAGFSYIPCQLLDHMVWAEVLEQLVDDHITGGDRLAALAQEQARLDTSGDPSGELSRLQRTRKDYQRKTDNLRATIADTDNPDSRRSLAKDLDHYNELLAEAEEEIAACERFAHDDAHRQAVLGNIRYQVDRYMTVLTILDVDTPADIPLIRTICRSLGIRPTVTSNPRVTGRFDVTVDWNLGMATGEPWFPSDAAGTDPEAELREARQKALSQLDRLPQTPPQRAWDGVGIPATPGPLGPQIAAALKAEEEPKGNVLPAPVHGLC